MLGAYVALFCWLLYQLVSLFEAARNPPTPERLLRLCKNYAVAR